MTVGSEASVLAVAVRMAVEQALSRIVQLDAVTAQRLAELDGCLMHVSVTSLSLDLFIRLGERPVVLGHSEQPADCALTGSVFALSRLLKSQNLAECSARDELYIEGDEELLEQVLEILRTAEFDWEALLAEYSGGLAARGLGNLFRQGRSSAERLQQTALANLPEYLQEELRMLPAAGETEAFAADLQALEHMAGQLAERTARLQQQVSVSTPKSDNTQGRG